MIRFSYEGEVAPAIAVKPFGGTSCIWFNRCRIDKKTYRVTLQLYRHRLQGQLQILSNMAADDTTKALRVVRIGSNVVVGNCHRTVASMYETIGIALDATYS